EAELFGCLRITVNSLRGVEKSGHYCVQVEMDSYENFGLVAITRKLPKTSETIVWNEEFIVDMDSAQELRFHLLRDSEEIADLALT
ncbi:hypothetical protein Ciccas_010883, partial [Cichlidogyrus casuarinus]